MTGDTTGVLRAEIRDMLRLTALHYGLWFAEAERVLGPDAAMDCEAEAGERFMDIAGARLKKVLSAGDGRVSAEYLTAMDEAELSGLADALAVNWLAADGVWFQAVEKAADMTGAKRVNDACWKTFAPLEARMVMTRLGLARGGGLDVLERALAARMYARINTWKIEREPGALVFTMLRCRVQDARARKGLPEYPCKSGGLVEYTSFAAAVDGRLLTTCRGCPPDKRDGDYACSWRFSLDAAPGGN